MGGGGRRPYRWGEAGEAEAEKHVMSFMPWFVHAVAGGKVGRSTGGGDEKTGIALAYPFKLAQLALKTRRSLRKRQ